MKKITIGLLVILALLLVTIQIIGKNSTGSLYDRGEHIEYSQITDHTDGINLFYVYMKSCAHCNNIKPDINKFYNNKPDNINFYFIEGDDPANSQIWYTGDEQSYEPYTGELTDNSQIKIVGTPTLITVEDGQVTNNFVGEKPITSHLESLYE